MIADTHTDGAAQSNTELTDLDSTRRSFVAAPSFTTLRKLAGLWSTNKHWELAAEAWIHVAHARPNDAQAYANAAAALAQLAKHADAARMWEQACRIQPHNAQYAHALAQAVRDSKQPIAQTIGSANCQGLSCRSDD